MLHYSQGFASSPATHRHVVLCCCAGGQGVNGGWVAQSLTLWHCRNRWLGQLVQPVDLLHPEKHKQTHLKQPRCSVPAWSHCSALHPGWGRQEVHWGPGSPASQSSSHLCWPAHVHLWPGSPGPGIVISESSIPNIYNIFNSYCLSKAALTS